MRSPTARRPAGGRHHRSRLVAIVVAVVALFAAACGGATAPATPTESAAPAASPTPAGPQTVTHIFGTTEVPADPKRVVALGYTDVDYLLALGITPVAYNDWFESKPDPFYLPWQQPVAKGATATHIPMWDGLQVEKVADANPDLIIATGGIDENQYQLLTQIAPTVGPLKEGDEVPAWQDMTRYVAAAFGKQAEGDKLIADLESRIAQVRAEHPEFAGKTLTFAGAGEDIYAWLPTDARNVLFEQLGFTLSQGVKDSAKYTTDTTGFSPETVYLLDADVFVAQAYTPEDRKVTEENPAFQNLQVVKRGDVIWPDEDTLNAITFGSVLSIPYVLDRIVPELAKTVAN